MTVECNPEDVTVELLGTYAAAGVTRISLGVQSLAPTCSRASAAVTARDGASAVGAIGEVGFDLFQRRPHLRRAGRRPTRTGWRHLDGRARPRSAAPARERLRPPGRARHALWRDTGSPP